MNRITVFWTLILLPVLLWIGKKLGEAVFQESLARVKRRSLDRRSGRKSRALLEDYKRTVGQPFFEAWIGLADARSSLSREVRRHGAQGEAESLKDVAAREAKLVLLGEPGMGKSTALRQLESAAAWRGVPVYVELKRVTAEGLEPLMAARIRQALAPQHRLPHDEAQQLLRDWLAFEDLGFVLLFDGLNEVAPESRSAVQFELQTWIASRHQVVVSCRARDYSEGLKAPSFLLQPLRDYQIERYLGHQFYESHVRWRPQVSQLAGNPFLLALIATVAEASPKKELPENLGKLFEQALPILARLRSNDGVPARVPPDVVFAALAKAAFEMQRAGKLSAPYTEVYGWALPTAGKPLDDVLVQAREWRILGADSLSGDPLEFLHQLIQEYFAAAYLAERLRHGEHPADDVLESPWHETVKMLAGIAGSPQVVLQWLSTRMIATGRAELAELIKSCWETSAAATSAGARAVVTDALKYAMKSGDSETRQSAAFALRGFGAADTADALLEALRDPDWHVRERAGYELRALRDPGTVPALIESLGDPQRNVRLRATEALREMADARAVAPLIAALDDSDESVVQEAVGALGKLGDERAVAPLVARLGESSYSIKSALNTIGGPAVDALTARLHDPDKTVRNAAAEVLGEIRDTRAIEPLRQLMDGEPDEAVRRTAAYALARIGTPMAFEPLRAALGDSSDDVRRIAADGIGSLRDSRALDTLVEVLRDSSPAVRRIAASALGGIGDRRALEPLLGALDDPEQAVVDAAANSLAAFGGAELVDPLIAAFRRSTSVGSALITIGRPAVKPVVRLLHDRNQWTRLVAASILSEIGDRRAARALKWVALRRRGSERNLLRTAADNIRRRIS
ncbi:MAG TPA: HEAT repeat domain-containing protein [Terriglobia bacterium]|nr:HEAT repeat domain-containing protein [Terriglobia bacterium]